MNIDHLNRLGSKLRTEWLPNEPGKNNIDAAIEALGDILGTFMPSVRVWRTAQLTDGRIVGCFAETAEAAVVDLAFWWGVDVAWVVDDPGCLIHARYRATVLVKDHQTARWPVTSAPVDHPAPMGVAKPEAVQVALFDMFELS